MSTTDPVAARRARLAQPASTTRIVVVLLVLLVGGIANGYGWTADHSQFGWYFAVIPVGMSATIVGLIAWTPLVLRDRRLGLGQGLAAVAFGVGIGALLAAAQGASPTVAAIAFPVAGVLLALSMVARRRRRRKDDEAAELRATGRRTTATVSDPGFTHFGESARVLTTVTFTFRDAEGTQRWVQRPMVVRASDPVVAGQETDLWFDPAAPGDDSRIVVELAHATPVR